MCIRIKNCPNKCLKQVTIWVFVMANWGDTYNVGKVVEIMIICSEIILFELFLQHFCTQTVFNHNKKLRETKITPQITNFLKKIETIIVN